MSESFPSIRFVSPDIILTLSVGFENGRIPAKRPKK